MPGNLPGSPSLFISNNFSSNNPNLDNPKTPILPLNQPKIFNNKTLNNLFFHLPNEIHQQQCHPNLCLNFKFFGIFFQNFSNFDHDRFPLSLERKMESTPQKKHQVHFTYTNNPEPIFLPLKPNRDNDFL